VSLATVLLLVGSVAFASPTIDGIISAGEYTTGHYVDYTIEGGGSATGGQIWYSVDGATGDVSLAFCHPLTLVDNTYGVNAVGWPGDNHKFKHLSTSDNAHFSFTGTGGQYLDFALDYLSTSAPYVSDGLDPDGGMYVGNPAHILAWSSSMEWNYAQYGAAYPLLFGDGSNSPETGSKLQNDPTAYVTTDAGLADWAFEVTYEVLIDADAFPGSFDITHLWTENVGGATIVSHLSPNKIGNDKVYPRLDGVIPPDTPPPPPIPEPGTMLLLGLGLGGLVIARVRKNRRS
jgi:hypothetical protein